MKKFIKGPDGTIARDSSYVGEDAWDDDSKPQDNVKQILDSDVKLNEEEKKELKKELGISGLFGSVCMYDFFGLSLGYMLCIFFLLYMFPCIWQEASYLEVASKTLSFFSYLKFYQKNMHFE